MEKLFNTDVGSVKLGAGGGAGMFGPRREWGDFFVDPEGSGGICFMPYWQTFFNKCYKKAVFIKNI